MEQKSVAHSQPEQGRSNRAERAHRRAERRFWIWSLVVSAVSAVTAVIAMSAAITAAIFTGKSLTTSRQTLIAAERPWLAVTQAAPAAHGEKGLTSLDFTDRGAEFGIQYRLKNFGKSPALKIVAHLKTYLLPFNDFKTNLFDINFVKYQEQACDDDTGIPPDYNETVYPDVDRPIPIISPDAVWDDMIKRPIGEMKADSAYELVVAGCFSYVYYADGHVYHTYVANGIAGKTDSGFALFNIKWRGTTPAGQWQVVEQPMGKNDD
jgi:hypothetical protein